jgi:carbonic anhydrase
MKKIFINWKDDIPASLVVYLVALPLCLGIALASTGDSNHLFAGIIAGVVGGIVVGFISGSNLGVSGPAAGLITIVTGAIATIGSFEGFLVAVILSGIIQVIAGFLKAGVIGHYFPSAVIKGMLAAIGITLILKEIPHAVGFDADFMGDESFFQFDKHNTLSELLYALKELSPGAIITTILSIIILILFEKPFLKKISLFKILPGALFVVLLGIAINVFLGFYFPAYQPEKNHLVQLPIANSFKEFSTFFIHPDFSVLSKSNVYAIAFTLALVGSVETLLSADATDKLDPKKSHSPRNLELKAQGVGNIVSGFLGGLPITQVIVRSSANITSGGKSKLSTIVHGALLILTAVLIPSVLNLIPLASLSAVLLMVGYKLSKLDLYKQMFRLGIEQYLPFISTIIGVLFTNLLIGIFIGIIVSVFFILRKNYRNNFTSKIYNSGENKTIEIILSEEVTFINKGSILSMLNKLPNESIVQIDGSKCKDIDYDVLEILNEFKSHTSKDKKIQLTFIGIPKVVHTNSH